MTRLRVGLGLSIAAALGNSPDPGLAQGVGEIVRQEVMGERPGGVIALHSEGELQFLEAFGGRSSSSGEPLVVSDLFAYPAISEIILSVMIEALHTAGIVDGDAAIASYLPDLSPGVGRATLRELVSHNAGLDDAERIEGETWEQTLDRIDDRALVAEPGFFYSRSRHSFPLAGRVLTVALGRPFADLVETLILEPLRMTSSTFDIDEARGRGLVAGVIRNNDPSKPTRDVEPVDTLAGLPVLFTNAIDVVTFLSAWTGGELSGSLPQEMSSVASATADADRVFGGGLWRDEYRGLTRASRVSTQLGVSPGFYLVPESGTTVFIWWRGRWGNRTARFVLDAVADAAGALSTEELSGTRSEADVADRVFNADRWSGTYRNGDSIFELRNREGALALFDGSRELAMEAQGGSRVVARLPDGRVAVRLDLIEDGAGRRFLFFGGLAYRHGADPLGS